MTIKLTHHVLFSTVVLSASITADAHYIYANGRYYYHSVGCAAEIKDVTNVSTAPASAECAIATTLVESLCANAIQVSLPLQSILSAQSQIRAQHITGRQAHIEITVPDSPLLSPVLNTACNGASPTTVLIRNFVATTSIYRCVGLATNPCSVRAVTSTAIATCTLPPQFNLINMPTPGTEFTCTAPVVTHIY